MKSKMIQTLLLLLFFVPALTGQVKSSYLDYLRAQLLISEGKYQEAVKSLKSVLDADPGALAANKDLISIHLKLGDREIAIKAANELARKHNDIETHKFLARTYLGAGAYREAAYYYKQVLEHEPSNEDAMLFLANYYQVNNPEVSLKYWRKIAAQRPSEASFFFRMAEAYERIKQYDMALQNYNKALGIEPEYNEIYLALARIYEVLKDTTSAISGYRSYLKSDPENLIVLNHLGSLYYSIGDLKSARDIFQRMVDISTSAAQGYVWLGIIDAQNKKVPQAILSFKRAAQLDPSSLIFQYISKLYIQKGEYREAKRHIRTAIRLNPSEPRLHFYQGLLNMHFEKYAAAARNFRKAIRLKPDFYEAYFYAAVCYDRLNKFEKMRRALEKVLSINPEHARAMNYLAYSLALKGKELEYAQELSEKSLKLDPENNAYIDTLGWIYFKQGRINEAEEMIEKAASDFNDWEIFYHLAIIKETLGKINEAHLNYFKSYYFGPKPRKRREIISKLRKLASKIKADKVAAHILSHQKKMFGNVERFRSNFTGNFGAGVIWGEIDFLAPDELFMKVGTGMIPVVFRLKDSFESLPFESQMLPNEIINYVMRTLRRLYSGALFVELKNAGKPKLSGSEIRFDLNGEKYVLNQFNGDIKYFTDRNYRWVFKEAKVHSEMRLPTRIIIRYRGRKLVELRFSAINISTEKYDEENKD